MSEFVYLETRKNFHPLAKVTAMSFSRRHILGAAVLSPTLIVRPSMAAQPFYVSVRDELRLGALCWQAYAKEAGLSDTPQTLQVERYLGQVGGKMTHHLRRPMPYTFKLDPNPRYISACAYPGGLVITGGGILSYADSEDALAAVLGHEIMHCDLGHTTGRMEEEQKKHHLTDAQRNRIPVDDYGNTYSHDQELAADREGVKAAVAAGYSPYGMRRLFELFAFVGRDAKPRSGSLTIQTRMARLDHLIAQYGWKHLKDSRTPLDVLP